MEKFHKARFEFFPQEATNAGIEGYNDKFPNSISEKYRKDLHAFYTKNLATLSGYDYATLTETERMSYDVLKWECDMGLEALKFPTHLVPIDQMWSPNLVMGQYASGTSAQPFKTVQDYDHWLKRVTGFIVWSDTAIANMRRGITQGYVLPVSLIKKVIPQMEALAGGSVEKHLYYMPATLIPETFSKQEKEKISREYAAMVTEQVMPLHARMTKFLKEEYLPKGRTSSGVSVFPDGAAFYQHRIQNFTTTTLTADQVFALGEKEVARIRSEMEKVKAQVGFNGDLRSFFDHVRANPALKPFIKPEEVLANFNAIHERMKPQLKMLFDKTPKTPFEIRRTEAFREASASAEYIPGSTDGSRPGIFYVPIPDVKTYNLYADESLFLHEAIPGHHYQLSLQQENTSLPEFRKLLQYSAFSEGWALYTESLGKELGLYTDPYQYFGMLSAEMHRAIRLVVDAGMHAKGWTREQAIQYSMDNEAESPASIESEIERYMAMPGQALSYKIGQLKILELRQKSQAAQGNSFDIKAFHNIVLGQGCIPLKLLEDEVDRWIVRQQ